MKLSFLEYWLLIINGAMLLFQLMLMGSIPSFFEFSILNLFIPLVVLANLFFFLYWLFKMKWPLLLFMVAFLIGYNQWTLLYQFPKNTIRKSSATFSVMSYNVRLFNQYNWIEEEGIPQKIESLIREKNPDVICFQEYSKNTAPRLEGYEYKYIQPSRSMGKSPLAIFSKLPILDRGYIDFEESSNSGAYVDISYRAKRIRVYNLHLESFRIDKEDSLFSRANPEAFQLKFDEVFKKQQEQIKQFQEVASSHTFPSIVCTDLNNTQFSRTYKALSNGMLDAFVEAGNGLGQTFYFASFPLRIDFIFVDKQLKVNSFEVIQKNYSDHFPIFSRLGIN